MLVLAPPLLRAIEQAAESCYPEESCGLLVGHGDHRLVVTRVVAADNIATDRRTSFEVDPIAHFRLMRALQGGNHRIIGHYHSHPDGAATPSARDLAMAFEPEFCWIITSLLYGTAASTKAYRLNSSATGFDPVPINLTCN